MDDRDPPSDKGTQGDGEDTGEPDKNCEKIDEFDGCDIKDGRECLKAGAKECASEGRLQKPANVSERCTSNPQPTDKSLDLISDARKKVK